MSLVFKPRISFNFGSGRSSIKNKPVHREELVWSEPSIQELIVLRALRCTYRECGQHFSRTPEACSNVVNKRDLYPAINKKREELLTSFFNL